MSSPARIAAAAMVVVLGLALAVVAAPFLARDREAVTGTPGAPPFQSITPVALRAGQEACATAVAFDRGTARAVLTTAPDAARSGPPLRVRAQAPGFRATGRVAGGYGPRQFAAATLGRAAERSAIGSLCVRNEGPGPASFVGTREKRAQSRQVLEIDGRRAPADLTLRLTEAQPRSIAARAGTVLDHVAAFKPWPVGRVTLGLLGLVVALVVPVLVGRALALALRDEP